MLSGAQPAQLDQLVNLLQVAEIRLAQVRAVQLLTKVGVGRAGFRGGVVILVEVVDWRTLATQMGGHEGAIRRERTPIEQAFLGQGGVSGRPILAKRSEVGPGGFERLGVEAIKVVVRRLDRLRQLDQGDQQLDFGLG